MNIVCLDLEGVLVPEIWIAFSEASGIKELRRTTRDEPDYDKLMTWRLGILREHGLGIREIQAVIDTVRPLPGAKRFLDKLRSETQAVILSDTFTQFAAPLMKSWAGRRSSAIRWRSHPTAQSRAINCARKRPSSRRCVHSSPSATTRSR